MTQEALSLTEPSRGGLRDRILALRSQPMFTGVDDEGLLLLAEHARSASYHPGEVLCAAGETVKSLVIVIDGEVELSDDGASVHATIPSGGAFGALALLSRSPTALAVARRPTRTMEIPASMFETALDQNYSVLRNAITSLGRLVLQSRGNLPADPHIERTIDEGTYYAEPKTMVERLIQLRSGGFGYMNLEALIDLARHMIEVRYPEGQLLWHAGDFSSHSLTIDCGRVRCTAPDGATVDVGRDFTLGVLDVWGPRRRAYDVRAATPVIGYRVNYESFLTLLESHVEVGIELLRGFAIALVTERKAK